MSIFLRSLPAIALRSKPSPLASLSLLYFAYNNPVFIPRPLPKRSLSSLSASASSAATPVPSAETDSKKPPIQSGGQLKWVTRTRYCGELSESDVGKRVRLCGWVALHRVHGGLTFFNLRDHTGIVQVLNGYFNCILLWNIQCARWNLILVGTWLILFVVIFV